MEKCYCNTPENIRNPPLNALRGRTDRTGKAFVRKLVQALILLVLAAAYHSAIRLNLVPVYGQDATQLSEQIPMLTYSMIYLFMMWCGIDPDLDVDAVVKWLPIHALVMPTIMHSPLFRWSSWLGNRFGPRLTEICMSLFPVWTSLLAFAELTRPRRPGYDRRPKDYVVVVFATAAILYTTFDYLFAKLWPLSCQITPVITRATLPLLIGCMYALCFPSKLLFGASAVVLYTSLFNPHMPWGVTTARLNQTLHANGYLLLERRESVTGYISVVESIQDQFRVMRCDHSLLGGEWLPTPERVQEGIVKPETIYSAFTILEAVRLIQVADTKSDGVENERSLVIGLGVGTSPKALSAHGVDTKVIELDPAVIEFSKKYFALPENVTTINQDAVDFVRAAVLNEATGYNYIIHDVFTGGAEPAALFTLEFLNDLRALMKYDGVIAINYTANLRLKSTAIVMKTIMTVFKSCRAFRDTPAPEREADDNVDFVNLVVFCTKHTTKWKFRQPVEADFLQSMSRRQNLPPRFEISWEEVMSSVDFNNAKVLRRCRLWNLQQYSIESARGHWKVMRKVLPDVVWINW